MNDPKNKDYMAEVLPARNACSVFQSQAVDSVRVYAMAGPSNNQLYQPHQPSTWSCRVCKRSTIGLLVSRLQALSLLVSLLIAHSVPVFLNAACQVMFETFNVPGLQIAVQAVLALIASWYTQCAVAL